MVLTVILAIGVLSLQLGYLVSFTQKFQTHVGVAVAQVQAAYVARSGVKMALKKGVVFKDVVNPCAQTATRLKEQGCSVLMFDLGESVVLCKEGETVYGLGITKHGAQYWVALDQNGTVTYNRSNEILDDEM